MRPTCTWRVTGDPTEGAIVVAALKAGIAARDREQHILYEIPFDSERKAMSVVMRGADGSRVMYSKGAPEVILAKCVAKRFGGQVEPLTIDRRRRRIMQSNSEITGRALRVLALAYRDHSETRETEFEEAELIFAGLVGMIDPPREEARKAGRRCRMAGIRPVVITGDHPETALAIARELHIAGEDDRVVTGQDLNALSDEELGVQVDQITVYARVRLTRP